MSDDLDLVFKTCLEDVDYFIERFEKRVARDEGSRFLPPLDRLRQLRDRLEHIRELDIQVAPEDSKLGDSQTEDSKPADSDTPEPSKEAPAAPNIDSAALLEALDSKLSERFSKFERDLKNRMSSTRFTATDFETNILRLQEALEQKLSKFGLTLSTVLERFADVPDLLKTGLKDGLKDMELRVQAIEGLLAEHKQNVSHLDEQLGGLGAQIGETLKAVSTNGSSDELKASLETLKDSLSGVRQELNTVREQVRRSQTDLSTQNVQSREWLQSRFQELLASGQSSALAAQHAQAVLGLLQGLVGAVGQIAGPQSAVLTASQSHARPVAPAAPASAAMLRPQIVPAARPEPVAAVPAPAPASPAKPVLDESARAEMENLLETFNMSGRPPESEPEIIDASEIGASDIGDLDADAPGGTVQLGVADVARLKAEGQEAGGAESAPGTPFTLLQSRSKVTNASRPDAGTPEAGTPEGGRPKDLDSSDQILVDPSIAADEPEDAFKFTIDDLDSSTWSGA